jgi:hypothetical protein
MNWLHQRRSLILYFILTLAIGLSIYFVLTGIIGVSSQLFKVSIADSIKACGRAKVPSLVTPLDNYSSLKRTVPKASPLALQVGSIQLKVNSHFLTAKTENGEVETAVAQPDYGIVRSLHLTQSGEVFVLGEQISYRLRVSVHNGMPVLTKPVPLPFLFSKTCGFWGRITRSCVSEIATYSHELDAVFLSGHTAYGNFISLFAGLSSGDQDITNSGTPFFLGDIPNTGRVLLGGPKGSALYDGQKIIPCKENP